MLTEKEEKEDDPDDEKRQAVLETFSHSVDTAMDSALQALDSSSPSQRLQNLLLLQRTFYKVTNDRIADTRSEMKDLCIAESPLLSLSNELLVKIGSFLDEVALLALEDCTKPIYANDSRHDQQQQQRPCWNAQWNRLDQIRHSRSNLVTATPRQRGIQFARASWSAQCWERRLLDHHQQTIRDIKNKKKRRRIPQTLTCFGDHNQQQQQSILMYSRDNFLQDFGRFFQNPSDHVPSVEFFLRLTYNNESDGSRIVLLEGFQSNFESLRHVSDAQDDGHHTYIGIVGHDERAQAVMVRNDLHLLRAYMGLDERYVQMDSDDSELESDEEAEFHLLQWPEASRQDFLDRTTVTLLKCSLSENGGYPVLVGSTTGYSKSDQHFALFRPVHLTLKSNRNADIVSNYDDADNLDCDSTNSNESYEDPPRSIVKIGIGCGGGDSLHIMVKWNGIHREDDLREVAADWLAAEQEITGDTLSEALDGAEQWLAA